MTSEKSIQPDGETSRPEETSSLEQNQQNQQSSTSASSSTTNLSSLENDATSAQNAKTTDENPINKRFEESSSKSKSSNISTDHYQGPNADSNEMKREHAKQMIERYFYQLFNGCGNTSCLNRNCASSAEFQKLTPNEAAARAIQLLSEDAPLCDLSTAASSDRTSIHSNNDGISSVASSAPSKNIASENDDGSVANESLEIIDSETVNATSKKETETDPEVFNILHTASTSKMSQRTTLAMETLPYINEQSLNKLIDYCKKNNTFAPLIRNLGRYFSSREYLVRSFQKQNPTVDEPSEKPTPKTNSLCTNKKKLNKEDYRALEGDLDKDQDESGVQSDEEEENIIGNNNRNKLPRHHTTVDLISLRRAMTNLVEAKASAFDSLNNALQSLALSISIDIRLITETEKMEEMITVFVIIFEIIIIGKSDFVDVALPTICKAASYLPVWAQARLACIWSVHCKDGGLRKLLETVQQLISLQVITGAYHSGAYIQDNEHITNATKLMRIIFYSSLLAGKMEPSHMREEDDSTPEDVEESLFYTSTKKSLMEWKDPLGEELKINVLDCRVPWIPFQEFYNDVLSDLIEMDHEYLFYRQTDKFSFMRSAPFILTPASKVLGLYYDCRIRMYSERRINFTTELGGSPYLKLSVRRDHIIDDALESLRIITISNPSDLKKQLVVEFIGEQGIDEGGLSKEFFQLIVQQILDYGMLFVQQETQTMWFNSTSFDFAEDSHFTLIGIVLGLAIYNNIILPVNFPMVVYRKLLGIKGSFGDLEDYNPVIYNSLNAILNYDGDDIEEMFFQTFRISFEDVFGNVLTHELKEDGDSIFVSQTNKHEFVDLYADYLLNKSIEKQFRAFRRGFQMVTDESPLNLLFRPEEVELLVCGSKDFDFNELEKSTEYEGGYTEKSRVITDFWTIVHALPVESKRKLLEFTTGSDRVPVGGLSRLKLVIARNGTDGDRLPTSHTCYNVLLLPEYSTKEKLEEKLRLAILNSKGFGMI